MKFIETRLEKGKRVTRFCGIRILRRNDLRLSGELDFLRRELLTLGDVGNMPPARGMARDVQLAGAILLREVMRVADCGGFHPWMVGGSLLGTIRHGGRFIPWDDDVDVGLMREEYDVFCERFNEECGEGFYAWRRHSRKWNMIRVSHKELPAELTMSVMPFDRYFGRLPTFGEKHALFMKVRAEQDRLGGVYRDGMPDLEHFAAMKDSRERVILEGRGSAPAEAKPAIFRSVEFNVPRWVKEAVYDWDDIFPLKPAVFEGVRVMVPHEPEIYLTYNYGDWAGWPGRLQPHHPSSRFDIEKAISLRKFVQRHAPEAR